VSDLLRQPPEGMSVEVALDNLSLRSRYTPTETPQDHPELIEHVGHMLEGLTEAQRAAAETMGMASLRPGEAAALLGLRQSRSVTLAWYRATEKITGVTPPALESLRERKRKQRARQISHPRDKMSPDEARARRQQQQNEYIAGLRATERETGVTPPALDALRKRRREQSKRRKQRLKKARESS
jgi:hypothetical protein